MGKGKRVADAPVETGRPKRIATLSEKGKENSGNAESDYSASPPPSASDDVPIVKLGHFMLGIGADVFDDEDSNSKIIVLEAPPKESSKSSKPKETEWRFGAGKRFAKVTINLADERGYALKGTQVMLSVYEKIHEMVKREKSMGDYSEKTHTLYYPSAKIFKNAKGSTGNKVGMKLDEENVMSAFDGSAVDLPLEIVVVANAEMSKKSKEKGGSATDASSRATSALSLYIGLIDAELQKVQNPNLLSKTLFSEFTGYKFCGTDEDAKTSIVQLINYFKKLLIKHIKAELPAAPFYSVDEAIQTLKLMIAEFPKNANGFAEPLLPKGVTFKKAAHSSYDSYENDARRQRSSTSSNSKIDLSNLTPEE